MKVARARLVGAIGGTAVAIALVLAVIPHNVGSPAPFRAALVETGAGTVSTPWGTSWYANMTLTFQSPGSIDPTRLVISLVDPNGSFRLFNGSTIPVGILPYSDSIVPHWCLTTNGNEIWTAYNAEVKNPDGNVVGAIVSNSNWIFTPHGPDSRVISGATITLSFPIGTSPAQYAVAVTESGAPGSANLTLE